MIYIRRKRKKLISILISAVLLPSIWCGITPEAFSEEGVQAPAVNQRMVAMTGEIERIGEMDIVINDTLFKLSDNVSITGYKVGDRVKIAVTDNYEIVKIRHAERRKKAKE